MEISRAASNISRVSRWTFFSQATMDSVSFAGHLTFAILAEGRASLSLMVPAFLVCVLFVHEAVSASVYLESRKTLIRYLYSNLQCSYRIFKVQRIIRLRRHRLGFHNLQ